MEVELVAGTQVAVQLMLLQMLEQRAARAVHDALGLARRARREHDEERMVERELPPFEARGVTAHDQIP